MLINILTEPCVILQIGQERPRYEIAELGLFLPSLIILISYFFFRWGLYAPNPEQWLVQLLRFPLASMHLQCNVRRYASTRKSSQHLSLKFFCLNTISKFYAINVSADCFKKRYQYGTPSIVMCSQRNTWIPKRGKKTKIWRLLWSQILKIMTQN